MLSLFNKTKTVQSIKLSLLCNEIVMMQKVNYLRFTFLNE